MGDVNDASNTAARGKRILWLDNDLGALVPYTLVLTAAGYDVRTVARLGEAGAILAHATFDLVIIDVMIPTFDDEEATIYPVEETKFGYRAGLVFFERHRERIRAMGAQVLILTVRTDIEADVRRLESVSYSSKGELRNPQICLAIIEKALGRAGRDSA